MLIEDSAGAETTTKIAVIGGGITGLSAAYYAVKLLREAGKPVEITLLEASGRLGGRIETLRRGDFVIERGPDSFLARKTAIIELSKELGLVDELVPTTPQAKKTYILHRGKLHLIPPGMVMGIPTQWKPLAATGLISTAGKLRAAMDLFLPASRRTEDESLGGFLRRRLGGQVVERIAEPLLSGIYAGDADRLSLMATFPQFRTIERKYRSLIIGMSRGAGATRSGAGSSELIPKPLRGSVFLSYRRGLQTLVDALDAELARMGVQVRKSTAVELIRKSKNGGTELALSDGTTMLADAAIVTAPAPHMADMLSGLPEAEPFKDMQYASVANVVLVYRKEDVEHHLEGSGFVIPKTEGRFITACTWTSSKWGHTAPSDKAVIRCYVGRSFDERWLGMSEEQLITEVRKDIAELTGIRTQPESVDINRLEKSMPQYNVGHADRVEVLRNALQRSMPGVIAAGAAFDGVGLPDCIQQGKEAAQAAIAYANGNSLMNGRIGVNHER